MANRAVALLLLLVLLTSGCASNTGDIINATAAKGALENQTIQANQTPEDMDELHKEFQEFERSQATINHTNAPAANSSKQNPNVSSTGGGGTPSSEKPVKACPSSCQDSNPCTSDSCSSGANYECVHLDIIPCCGNSQCEQGENFTTCQEDCPCALECETCEAPDNQSCSCLPKGCASGDGCCPGGCNFTTDSDCPNPDMCSQNSECDDSDSCTTDLCSGDPKECSHTAIAECSSGDGCCPQGCMLLDSDCPAPSVVFSEIYYNPIGNDKDHEWIEIYNNGTIDANLSGWRFQEGATQHKIVGMDGDVLAKGSYAVIAQNATQFMYDYPGYSSALFDSSFDLSNSNETLILRIGKDQIIMDEVSYSSEWGGNGNGSLEKIELSGPNMQGNWNQSVSERGTPGERNSISVI